MLIPNDIKYSDTHMWVRQEDDGSISVGVSDPLQLFMGEITFIEFPEEGLVVKADQEVGLIESESTSQELFAPIAGEITELNHQLSERTELINKDAYHDGWLFKMIPDSEEDLKNLLDAEEYEEKVESLEW